MEELTADSLWENLQAAYRKIMDLPPARPEVLRCDSIACRRLLALIEAPTPQTLPGLPNTVAALFGIPIVVDDTLAPGEWRLVAHDGNVTRAGNVLAVTPSAAAS